MKAGVLFSGGKDSAYAMFKAMQAGNEIACLISVISENKASYMFHTPNISLTELQAEAIGLPLLKKNTKGEKEKELVDLEEAIKEAKEKFGLEGIVTGALESKYQATRIQKICEGLGLECINPLWMKDQVELLKELIQSGFEVIVSGVFAYPLGKEWLGKKLDSEMVEALVELREKYGISPSGEGGELETTVLDAPFFKKKLVITKTEEQMSGPNSGVLAVIEANLKEK